MAIRKDTEAITAYDAISVHEFEEARKMVSSPEQYLLSVSIANMS